MSAVTDLPAFRNEPILELRRAPVRDGLAAALSSLDAKLPLGVPVLVRWRCRARVGRASLD